MELLKKILLLFFLISISFLGAQGNNDPGIEVEVKGNTIISKISIPEDMHATKDTNNLFIDIEPVENVELEETQYPEGHLNEYGEVEYSKQVILKRPIKILPSFQKEKLNLTVYSGYQLCDEAGVCHFPVEKEFNLELVVKDGKISSSNDEVRNNSKEINKTSEKISYQKIKEKLDDFKLADMKSGYIKSEKFIEFAENAKIAEGMSSNTFAGKSIFLILFLIIIGGIALNLTPCVLPMMPITVAVLGAGTQAESKGKGFLIGGIYGLGMMLAYGTLGLFVVLTGSQFGTINSSPWFNLIIAVLFIVLSLAMFDIIPIDLSRFKSSNMPGQKKGIKKYIGVFFLGIIAAVLAGACVAPVLISVILYSVTLYTAGNTAGLLLPFLLGFGMAIPWPFVGAGLSILPKPGNWMKWINKIFGIIILVIALYYGYTAYHIFTSQAHSVEQTEESSKETSKSILPWNHSIIDGLEIAKKENKPVLIDFWATWCKNCLAMDASTFKDLEVKEALKDYVLIKYQAEDLKASPNKEILERYNIMGLPTYIVLVPKETKEE